MEKGDALLDIGREGLTRHPDAQNLTRSLPHQINAGVAKHAHDRNAEFAARTLRFNGHESPAPAHLEQVVDHLPIPLASDDFGCSRLQAEIALLLGPGSAESHYGVERQRIGRSTAELFSDQRVFADRFVPLNARAPPPAHHGQTLLEPPQTGCGKRQAADGERSQRDPQAVIFSPQAVFNRYIDVVKCRYAVVNPSHALETQTSDRAPWPMGFNDEGPIALLRLGVVELLWPINDSCDDDQHGRQKLAVLLGRICNEEFFPREAIRDGLPILCDADSACFYFGDVAAYVSFRECKP